MAPDKTLSLPSFCDHSSTTGAGLRPQMPSSHALLLSVDFHGIPRLSTHRSEPQNSPITWTELPPPHPRSTRGRTEFPISAVPEKRESMGKMSSLPKRCGEVALQSGAKTLYLRTTWARANLSLAAAAEVAQLFCLSCCLSPKTNYESSKGEVHLKK